MKPSFRLIFLSITIIYITSNCTSYRNYGVNYYPSTLSVKKPWYKWIVKNSFPIETVSDNNDLKFLQDIIGNATLVQLGESSHGVKEFNQIKVRIIKYLHEEMDFNVIAFESGLYECYNINNNSSSKNPRQLIGSIFNVWRTEEVLELFKYILKTREAENPLILAGFDFQMSGDWDERSKMLEGIVSFLDQNFAKELFKCDSLFAVNKKLNNITAMRSYVEKNQVELRSVYSTFKRLLENNMTELTQEYKSDPLIPLYAHQISASMLDYIEFWLDEANEMSIRDKAMADNVSFLRSTIYPDEKIIIWAHNLHIRHKNEHLDQTEYNKTKSMGSWLHERYPEDLYTIGLYMYRGQATYNNKEVYTVLNHSSNSLESILHSAGHEICFVDLKHSKRVKGNLWMSKEILTKTWGLEDLKMVPIDQYDAILFIDTVSPPAYLN